MAARQNNRTLAIFWTNGGLFYWRIYMSLGIDELMKSACTGKACFQSFCSVILT